MWNVSFTSEGLSRSLGAQGFENSQAEVNSHQKPNTYKLSVRIPGFIEKERNSTSLKPNLRLLST